MVAVFLFIIALASAYLYSLIRRRQMAECLLRSIMFFNMGLMGWLAAYAHTFMAAETAGRIGWAAGSPFQFEVAMANLSYGVLGLFGFTARRPFYKAAFIGWATLLIGCFFGHIYNYETTGNSAPLNIGVYVFFNDLFLPLLALFLLTKTEKSDA